MKKLLMLVFSLSFVILLTGCGDKVKTTVCDYTDSSGKISFDVSATNNEIDKIKMIVVPSNESMSITTFKDIDEETKGIIKESFLATYGLEKDTYDGLKISVEFDDNMTVTFDADLKVADKDLLKKIGMDFEGKDMDFDKFVTNIEAEGYTCK